MKNALLKKAIVLCAALVLCFVLSSCTNSKPTVVDKPDTNKPAATEGDTNKASSNSTLTYTGEGVGYVIKFENGKKFYITGDTGLIYDMKGLIGDYYKPDVAFIPAGDVFTMDQKAAAKAAEWINPVIAIPDHYNSYPVLDKDPSDFVKYVGENKKSGVSRAVAKVLVPGKEETIEGVKVLWFGHATFRFTSPTGTKIFVDPWFGTNPGCPAEFKPKGSEKDTAMDYLKSVGQPDIILMTHGHSDHLEIDEVKKLTELFKPVIVAQWELGLFMQPLVAPGTNVILVNKGCSLEQKNFEAFGVTKKVVPAGMEIHMVPASHSSSK